MANLLRADIVLHRPNGALAAVVEVKNRMDLDRQVATTLRQNLIAHGILPEVPFFLLLSQDKAYLWKNRGTIEESAQPDLELSMEEVLGDYIPRDFTGRLRGSELEMVVYGWLTDLALSNRMAVKPTERSLAEVGFIGAIRDATLSREVA